MRLASRIITLFILLLLMTVLESEVRADRASSNILKTTPRELPGMKLEVPKIELNWVETIDEGCPSEKVCIEGEIENVGTKTAYNVHLRIELGGAKHIKPRTFLLSRLSNPVMESGDHQDFSLQINRKVPYKSRNEIKFFQVGKYNFKIIPLWSDQTQKTP